MEFQKIGLVGMGACGAAYAAGLWKAYGTDFRLIAAGDRARRLSRGVSVNGDLIRPDLAAKGWLADLVLFSTKNYDLESALEDARPYIGPHTVLLPTLNGITATAVLAKAFPQNQVLYGVDMGIDALRTAAGVTVTKPPYLVFGADPALAQSPAVPAVKTVLDRAGLPNAISENMLVSLWRKWMWNMGFNQVTAALDATYGDVAAIPEIYELAERAMFEVYAMAQYLDIPLSTDDILVKRHAYDHAAPFGKTSMAQDLAAGRRTEVDYFSGLLLTMAQEANQLCPVNHALYLLIKAKEQQNARKQN